MGRESRGKTALTLALSKSERLSIVTSPAKGAPVFEPYDSAHRACVTDTRARNTPPSNVTDECNTCRRNWRFGARKIRFRNRRRCNFGVPKRFRPCARRAREYRGSVVVTYTDCFTSARVLYSKRPVP